MLKFRIITAIILIPLVIAGIFFLSPLNFTLCAGLIFGMAGYEWAGLCTRSPTLKVSFLAVLGALMVLVFTEFRTSYVPIFVSSVVWILPFVAVVLYPNRIAVYMRHAAYKMLFGWLFLLSAWMGLYQLQMQPFGGYLLIGLLLMIWATDTCGYFVGRKWGKHKLSAVSPGKSIEGVIGGVIGALVVGIAIFYGWQQFDHQSSPFVLSNLFVWLLFSLLISTASVIGDLFESLLKRLIGVKDSGRLLPGHGGLLDRIDSLLPTLPIYALFILSF